MPKDIALKKAVNIVLDHIPKLERYRLVKGAAVIGVNVVMENGMPTPKVVFWSSLQHDVSVLALSQIIKELEAQIAARDASELRAKDGE